VESAPAPITSGTSGDGQGQGARGFDIEGAIGQWLKESQAYKEEQRRQKEEERPATERELAQQEMGEKHTELLNHIVNTQTALASQQGQISQLMAMLVQNQVAGKDK